MKPINGLLSIGVVRVNDAADLEEKFAEVDAVMEDTFLTKDGNMGKISECGGVLPKGAQPLKCQ
eukprot:3217182-Pyramimonas_sp.AAC.2